MDRRSALKGLLFLSTAPSIIKIDTLMKLKPTSPTISYGNFKIGMDTYTVKVDCHNQYTVADLYKHLQYIWDNDDTKMDIDIPLEVITPNTYSLVDNWTIGGETDWIAEGSILNGQQ